MAGGLGSYEDCGTYGWMMFGGESLGGAARFGIEPALVESIDLRGRRMEVEGSVLGVVGGGPMPGALFLNIPIRRFSISTATFRVAKKSASAQMLES
jgi:hypothetical protein